MRAPLLVAFGFVILVVPSTVYGQHEHQEHEMEHEHRDAMRGALDLPMSRIASGTAWIPDETPMRAFMHRVYGWHVMLHGNLFAGYDYQGSDVGDEKLVSQNWIMGMARRSLGGGQLTARTMLSLEPLTVGKSGYPLLLASRSSSTERWPANPHWGRPDSRIARRR